MAALNVVLTALSKTFAVKLLPWTGAFLEVGATAALSVEHVPNLVGDQA